MSVAPASNTRGKLLGSYSSTSGVMPSSHVSLNSFRKLQSSKTLGDQQHCIRPRHAGLQQLIRIENEILPQHRQRRPRRESA